MELCTSNNTLNSKLVPTDDGDESSFLSKHIIILDIIFFYSSAGYAS